MPKGKQKAIDLITSFPAPTASPSYKIANKHANTASDEPDCGSDSSISVASIAALACQFYTRNGLHKHLLLLGPETLSKMLLSQVEDDQFRPWPVALQTPRAALTQPAEQNSYVNCVYCHKMFDKRQSSGCKVKHFGVLEELDKTGDEKEWTCCGMKVGYVGYDPDVHADPAGEEPYCYSGRHWGGWVGSGGCRNAKREREKENAKREREEEKENVKREREEEFTGAVGGSGKRMKK